MDSHRAPDSETKKQGPESPSSSVAEECWRQYNFCGTALRLQRLPDLVTEWHWHLFDATKGEFVPKNENGRVVVPRGAVVVSGSRPVVKGPSAGSGIHLYCPVIVKYRDEKTSGSVSLEELLR